MSEDTVSCSTCGTSYPAIFKDTEQGYRCAAVVSGSSVAGHYGSTVIDMEQWKFVNGRPDHIKEGVICDDCVEGLQKSGSIALHQSETW